MLNSRKVVRLSRSPQHIPHRHTLFLVCLTVLILYWIATGNAQTFALTGDSTADIVLGQPGFTSRTPNISGVNTTNLNRPWGVAIDPQTNRVYVADTSNHRVLSWPNMTKLLTYSPADMVLGQQDFISNQENQGRGNPDATTLNGPIAVSVDLDGNVYVADQLNNRVLRYDNPAAFDTTADAVFGQFTFEGFSEATTDMNLRGPWGVVADKDGNVYIADSNNHRVLQFDTPVTSDNIADRVFGQPDFFTSIRNNGGISASSLSLPAGLAIDAQNNLYVVDASNHRVLVYQSPLTTDTIADKVIGQPTFTDNTAKFGNPNAQSLHSPTSISVDQAGNLYVADFGNNRVLKFAASVSDTVADQVFGQPNFSTKDNNVSAVSAVTLYNPAGTSIDRNGNLIVVDMNNSRALWYEIITPAPTVTSTSTTTSTSTNIPSSTPTHSPASTPTLTEPKYKFFLPLAT